MMKIETRNSKTRRYIMRALVVVAMALSLPAIGDEAASHYRMALAYKRQGKIDEAIASLEQALVERKDYSAVHFSLGILYRQKNETQKAIFHLERAAELSPKAGDITYSLGLAYYQANQNDKAIAMMDRAVKSEPNNVRYLTQLGTLLIRTDLLRAIGYLERAVKLDGQSADALHQLGIAYRRSATDEKRAGKEKESKERLRKAEQFLVRASALKDEATLHFDLGVLYRHKNELGKAIEEYERATRMSPKLAAAWWDLASVYAKSDRDDDAVAAYKHFVALEGNSKSAQIARDRIKELGPAAPAKK